DLLQSKSVVNDSFDTCLARFTSNPLGFSGPPAEQKCRWTRFPSNPVGFSGPPAEQKCR
ncbi:hypothetical protein AVEN_24967-1, partial [Araneus ventricosus]